MVVIPNPSLQDYDKINHSYAISCHEVTVEQFRKFRPEHRLTTAFATADDSPVHQVDWYSCAEYCNWLSEQDGIPEDQWVYGPNSEGNFSYMMYINPNFLNLRGYRLPTSEEWEYAHRALATSRFPFGNSESSVSRYAWTNLNSGARCHPVKSLLPNRWGLFDTLGNASEWRQDSWSGHGGNFKVGGGSFARFPWDTGQRGSRLTNDSAGRGRMHFELGFRPVQSLPELDSR